ncbi:MAG: RHS repeat-associated core domain-containing protein [Thermoguttaceae bacterium]
MKSICLSHRDPQFVGDPVSALTGANVEHNLDCRLPAPLALEWWRDYDSTQCRQRFALGWGQTHGFDRTLWFDADGLSYRAPLGRVTGFPGLASDGDGFSQNGWVLHRISLLRYELSEHGFLSMEFIFRDPAEPARLARLFNRQHQIAFSYREDGPLQRITDSAGRTILVDEDFDGRIFSLFLADEHGERDRLFLAYDYDERGNLVSGTDAYRNKFTFEYDEENRLVRRTDRNGYSFEFAYDRQGRCIRTAGEDGVLETALDFEIPRAVTKVTHADGGEWCYFFNEAGMLTQISDPLGGARKFIRDDSGRLTAELDPNGNPTRFVYNDFRALVGKVTPLGQYLPLPEDPNATEPQAHRVATNPAEYEFGRLIDYEKGILPSAAQAAGVDVSAAAREMLKIRSVEPYPLLPEADMPPLAPNWWPEPRHGRRLSELGKLVQQTDELGRQRRWRYDANGNVVQFVDFDGGKWTYEYRSWNHLVREIDPMNAACQFEYNAQEKITAFVDGVGNRSEYAYDLNGQLVEVRRHGTVRERYTRDAAGSLLAKHAGDGRLLLQFEIGPGNLLVKRELASGDVQTFQYDESGRHLAAATKLDRFECAYDPLGNRCLEKRNGRGVEHVFRGWRRPGKSVWFDRFVLQYRSQSDGTLVITDPGGKDHAIRFLPHGLVERRFSNGSSEWGQYDSLGKCLFKSTQPKSARAWNRRYDWSGEGELRQVDDSRHGITRHEYDAAHRLARRIQPNGNIEVFEIDLAGNLLRQPGLEQVTLHEGNRLASANGQTFGYDDRNHFAVRNTPAGSIRYLYDSRDQLVRVETPDGLWEAQYDALGRRTRKTWASKTTEYFWNSDQLVAELRPDGSLRLYVYADPLALTPLLFLDYDSVDAPLESARRYFIFSDQIGTPQRIENEAGHEVWHADIGSYGQADVASDAAIVFNLRFPGHYADPEVGLYYNRFRYYDPVLGRYIQSDRQGIRGGRNLYGYSANPLLEVDVRGCACPGRKKKPPPKDDDDDDEKLQDQKGRVDEYGELKKTTGDGSCDRDHQPSKAALLARAEDIKGAPLTPEEKAQIIREANAVVVPKDIHQAGDTYGGKNTPEQIAADAADPAGAAKRDADNMVKNAKAMDPDDLPAYKAAAKDIKSMTNDDYDNWLGGIVNPK